MTIAEIATGISRPDKIAINWTTTPSKKARKIKNERSQAKLTQKDMPYIFTICQKQFESVALLLVLDNPRYKRERPR